MVGGGLVTCTQFTNAVTSNGYPAPTQAQCTAFNQGLSKGSISTSQEAAMALAQFLHESDGLRAMREYACASSGCPGQYATPSCDARGQHYYGRGVIQLSWCGNYRAASEALLGNDKLVSNPDSVASDVNLAWNTGFWFWKVWTFYKTLFGVANKELFSVAGSCTFRIRCLRWSIWVNYKGYKW